ncbi:MAG: hypothetical protein AT714_00505 [Vulcanisaeta sp. OSP_8]|jgi:hypothetical protein|nr:MAG: hypothetical protein AT714_00505 [Vulcanisaeta sp. OSP_8]
MGRRGNVNTWLWVIGIGLVLYLVNASLLINYQVLYYQNPTFFESLVSAFPMYSSVMNMLLQDGILGIMGTISIIILLIMAYLLTGIIINRSVGAVTRVSLIVLALVQLFMGNPGLIIGLILVLIGSLLMR